MYTPQLPVSSSFGPSSTAIDVAQGIDLTGKNAIVTGGSSGIGLETVRALASAGASVTVPARDVGKAADALGGIAGVTIQEADLAEPASIDAFAREYLKRVRTLDVLVNNAGMTTTDLARDGRGYELQFATNHLGHFQLTARLWPALSASGSARVVCVSSCGHAYASVDVSDPNFERRPFDARAAYGQSKSANALFALALDDRGRSRNVRAFSLHPGGMIMSGFARAYNAEQKAASGYLDERGLPIIDPDNNMKTLEQGAATSVWCATSPLLEGKGGIYCENSDIAVAVPADSTALLGARPWILDRGLAADLWALSERLTSVPFDTSNP